MPQPPVLRILWRDPASLRPAPGAAKAHPEEQIQALARSIAFCGLDQPLVVNAENELIKGHARRLAALRLGLRQAPVILRNDLPPKLQRLARLADNRCAEAHWLPDILARELAALSIEDGPLLEASGFSREQVQGYLQNETPPAVAPRTLAASGNCLERQCPHCGGCFAC